LADVAARTPVTEDTVFRVGSMTKTFTAVAVMQLVERGRLELDRPAVDYLRGYRLEQSVPGGTPPTVRDLLTHSAGVPEVVRARDLTRRLFGETVPVGARLPSLAEFYGGTLRTYAEPGTRFAYSDHNFTTLGQIVEDVSGVALADYFADQLFTPLGMTHTSLVRTETIASRLARGYTIGRRGARLVEDYELITAAAGGAYSTLRDMARYAAALLGGGANDHGRILTPESLATMFAPHYRPDPRLSGIGLSFWRAEADGHLVIDHGGILPGFNGELFLAPDDGIGVLAFTNGARGAMFWLPGRVAGMLSGLIGAGSPDPGDAGPQRPEVWGELCGRYQVRGRLTDLRAREMTGFGLQVLVRHGRLVLRLLTPVPALYRGLPLLADRTDPYAFWLDLTHYDIGMARVVFSRSPAGEVDAVHFDLLPMSADKQPPRRRRKRRPTAAPRPVQAASPAPR